MSKVDTLREQFPELNMSVIDILQMMDKTKTKKYLQLLCKLFTKQWKKEIKGAYDSLDNLMNSMESMGINHKGLTPSQMYFIRIIFWERFHHSTFSELHTFMDYMERGLIVQNDVGKYSSFDEINQAVSLVYLKELQKELSSQVEKVYEDDTWVAILPLTFESSAKYGSGTKWCTTYQKEKQYFARYWNRGILCYFINKKTGYKFAAFKSLDEYELSFWNAADNRTDYLDLEVEDYMFPIVKKILKSDKTNSEYLDVDMRMKVCNECDVVYDLPRRRLEEVLTLSSLDNGRMQIAIRDIPQIENVGIDIQVTPTMNV